MFLSSIVIVNVLIRFKASVESFIITDGEWFKNFAQMLPKMVMYRIWICQKASVLLKFYNH